MKKSKYIRKQHAVHVIKRSMAMAALLGCIHSVLAQGGVLATASSGYHGHSLDVEPAHALMANSVPSVKPITDDGHAGDALRSVAQLIFALECDRNRRITVEVFNEQGRSVQRTVLSARRGRNALAMNVDRLRAGRYVAMLHEEGSVRIVRFRR